MMRVGSAVTVVAVLLSACGPGARSEVRTNSGGSLDCPSQTILYAMLDSDVSQPGASSSLEAATKMIGSEFLPDGVPRLESPAGDGGAVVVVDEAGNRVGRVLAVHFDSGWHIKSLESCG